MPWLTITWLSNGFDVDVDLKLFTWRGEFRHPELPL